jgi:hypothetical protein
MRQGKIPPMRIDGKEVTIKFTSPMSRSQDNEDIQNVLSFVQSAQMIGPEAFMASVKVDAIPKLLAEKMGIPLELIRTEEEIQEMAAKAEEMMKAQQEQQQPQEPPIMEVPQ